MQATISRIQYQVKMTKGTFSAVYGTYQTKEEAEDVAETHRATGYWNEVTVNPVK